MFLVFTSQVKIKEKDSQNDLEIFLCSLLLVSKSYCHVLSYYKTELSCWKLIEDRKKEKTISIYKQQLFETRNNLSTGPLIGKTQIQALSDTDEKNVHSENIKNRKS